MEKKYPVLKCNEELWNEIKPVLESFGINDFEYIYNFEEYPFLISNYGFCDRDELAIGNIDYNKIDMAGSIRYLVDTKEEFLSAVAKLLGKEYPLMIFDGVDDYIDIPPTVVVDKQKVGDMSEPIASYDFTKAKGTIVPNNATKKKFRKKNKIENYIVSYDPTVGESSTVVATMPVKGNDFDKDKGSDLDIDKPMEKINIAEKLKHCKKGTKLYHLMFGEVEFDGIDNDDIFVITTNKDDEKGRYYVNSFGLYDINYPNGECLLFPSKDNRDWNNFQVLEESHRVMCSDDGLEWYFKLYKNNKTASSFDTEYIDSTWKYIVPIEDFDFLAEDITINKEKSIV